jgi:hypothetical protein
MDPYLEHPEVWPELHSQLISRMQNEMNRQLPDHLVASVYRHVPIRETNGEGTTHPSSRDPRRGSPFLQIEQVPSRQAVTVMELLTPLTKQKSRVRAAYLANRKSYHQRKINMVEMDLLRDGERVQEESAPDDNDYFVMVQTFAPHTATATWRFSVRKSLPTISIPVTAMALRLTSPSEPENLPLRLQTCFQQAYEGACFDKSVNYDRPPVPPLRPADAAWAKTLLAKRKRSSRPSLLWPGLRTLSPQFFLRSSHHAAPARPALGRSV